MHDYGFFSYDSKADFIERSKTSWNPDKTQFWQDAGVDLVIDRREGYLFWDMEGRRLIDLHLNGGTYNLGHRNRELITTLEQAMEHFDIGNHHFPALARTALAEELVKTAPPNMRRVIYGSGGGEAIDIAIKTARHTTQRRKIVSIVKGYHGHTGLAVATGDQRFSELFLSDQPDEFVQVPFNDLDAMEDALRGRDVAAVIMETIPATYGFPLPEPGYLEAVKALCERYGALYIADEVQTGLMRTGEMWGIQKTRHRARHHGRRQGHHRRDVPDRVRGGERGVRGLAEGGRLRPHLDRRRRRARLHRRRSRCSRSAAGPRSRSMVHYISRPLRPRAARDPGAATPTGSSGIRQNGVVMGLEFDHPQGAKLVMRELYENGVWAIFSTLDPRVLQFKPGILLDARAGRGGARPHRGRDRPGARRGARRPRRSRQASARDDRAARASSRPACRARG